MSHQNQAEEFVYKVCTKSFFSLWSYPNPIREDGKELCDILVHFKGNLVIFSVKNISFRENSNNLEVAAERWRRSAIDESVKQALGAERYLTRKRSFKVNALGSGEKFQIKDIDHLRIHKVSVSFGGKGQIPFSSGLISGRFVHILDEEDFWILFNELDTVGDFVEYLGKKEDYLTSAPRGMITHGEKDLLAIYLMNNRQFPEGNYQRIYIEQGMYEYATNKPEYIAKKEEDRLSYWVDGIIKEFIKHAKAGSLVTKTSLSELEEALAILAAENRLGRRMLGKSIYDLVMAGPTDKGRARLCTSDGLSSLYVILAVPHEMERENRKSMLLAYCHVAIGLMKDQLKCLEAVGIATEVYIKGKGYSFDLLRLGYDQWLSEHQEQMELLQSKCGFLRTPNIRHMKCDEYPEV